MTRLGLLVPSTNSVAERDFQLRARLQDDVTVHTSRMFIDATTATAERRMIREFLPTAARDLATVRPDVVVFSCTSAAAVVGATGEADIVRHLHDSTGAAVVSTNAAVHSALRAAGAHRVAVVTPYVDELTQRICEGIEYAGMSVVASAGMHIVDPFDIADVAPDEIVEFAAREIPPGPFDTMFVSCTNLRGVEAREDLVERFGVPVVTSNQAAADAAFGVLGESAPVAHGPRVGHE